MKVKLVALVTLATVLMCACDVLYLPDHQFGTDNKIDFAQKISSKNASTVQVPYSSLWKLEGSEVNIRAIQAKLMRSYMNFNVNPCDDFYEYACGNWENVNPIPKDKSEYTVFSLLNNNIQNELLEVLSKPVVVNRAKQELSAEDKARVYFATCTDGEAMNRRGVDPLLYFIDELGGWPVLDDNWSEEGFDWVQLAIKGSLLGYPSVLFTDIEMDLKNSSRYSIYLEETTLGLSNRDDFLNPDNVEHLDAYRNLIVTVLRLLDVDPEMAEDTAKEIVDFEIQLANITIDSQIRIDLKESYTPITIENLSKKYPYADWLRYLSGVQETPLHNNYTVVMLSAEYYANLTRILKEVESRTLANYIVWRCVHPFLDALDENFRAALHTFKEALTGQKEPLARWKECIKEINSEMGMATGAMFVRRYFDEDSRKETISLLRDVKEAFRETLHDLDWIDDETKKAAENKVNATKLAVGYPDFILNSDELNKLYNDVQVAPGKRFENSVSLEKYSARTLRIRFREPVDREIWPSAPAVVNAFFEQTNNRIVIPVGILQPPVFHKHFPRALNYGAIGVFVGHETTHGFDDVGRDFDSTGNMVPWWSPEAVKGFHERENCFIEQYEKYSVNGKFLQGSITRGENIADNGGIRQAFRVYRKWQNVNKKTKRDSSEAMPDLNLTNDQLFFVGFAQSWCNAIRPEAVENRLHTNLHCPGKFRVNGALANFEDFSEVFQCPTGSVMNPQKKCRLW